MEIELFNVRKSNAAEEATIGELVNHKRTLEAEVERLSANVEQFSTKQQDLLDAIEKKSADKIALDMRFMEKSQEIIEREEAIQRSEKKIQEMLKDISARDEAMSAKEKDFESNKKRFNEFHERVKKTLSSY